MPSDRRLHPSSILFRLGSQFRQFVVPALLLLVTAGSSGWGWQVWTLWFIVPYTLVAIAHCVSLRYRYGPAEMVIRTGLLFRNERHIPYARIQNLDAVQNVLHRLLRVVEVRVETGGGQEPEATLSVLPLAALDEMRRRVFADRAHAAGPVPTPGAAAPAPTAQDDSREAPRVLLALKPGDLLLHGVIQNRGMVVVGAAMGLLWEVGLWDRVTDYLFSGQGPGQGVARELVGSWAHGNGASLAAVALAAAVLVCGLLLVRVLSMGWSLLRLYAFTLSRAGDDLRSEFGLLTRVTATIPLRRVQTLTVREGPLHRAFARASLNVATAGGGGKGGASQREELAPILAHDRVPAFAREVLPEVDLESVDWRAADPRAFRRVFRRSAVLAILVWLPCIAPLGWWSLGLPALLLPWARLHARLYVKHLGWALTPDAVLFRSGWWWRNVSAASYAKIQAVAMYESPFDRRALMARVRVDTAGAGAATHRIDIPYLPLETARALFGLLSTQASQTTFRW
jgi:putative membrane protein